MKRKIFLSSIFVFFGSVLLTTFAQKPELKFNNDKKFKIVQFTDLHVQFREPKSEIVFERIDQVIQDEKPDFVILTGDIFSCIWMFGLGCATSLPCGASNKSTTFQLLSS